MFIRVQSHKIVGEDRMVELLLNIAEIEECNDDCLLGMTKNNTVIVKKNGRQHNVIQTIPEIEKLIKKAQSVKGDK